jgi:hypothetical protein
MSDLLSYAERELDLIGLTEDDEYNGAMRKHILHMVKEFAAEGHSGFSASYAISILGKLMKYVPLTPLTGEDSEWNDISDYGDGKKMRWQNNRRGSVFKDADGYCYDIDGKIFWEWAINEEGDVYKSYYGGSGSSIPVTFPYTIPDKPIYEYRWSNAEPRQPAQNEEGFI